MTPVRVTTEADGAEWDAFVAAHPAATGNHLWGWRGVYERAFGHRTEYLAARADDGTIVGVLPTVVFDSRLAGRFIVSLPFVNYGGVLATSAEAERALLDEAAARAARHGASHLELRHTLARFPGLPVRRHKVSMKATLPATAEAAWEALDKKVRNQIRKAEKAGVTVTSGGAELLDAFYGIFARNMRDLGTPVYPRAWFAGLLEAFPARTAVSVAWLEQRPVAAAVTFAHFGSVEIPSASSLREYRPSCANMLLYWHLMQRAIGQGFTHLDFGRSTPGESTFRFKEQWGAEPGPMNWEYRLLARQDLPDRTPANRKLQMAIAAWKRLPLPVANTLGPLVVRYLP